MVLHYLDLLTTQKRYHLIELIQDRVVVVVVVALIVVVVVALIVVVVVALIVVVVVALIVVVATTTTTTTTITIVETGDVGDDVSSESRDLVYDVRPLIRRRLYVCDGVDASVYVVP